MYFDNTVFSFAQKLSTI